MSIAMWYEGHLTKDKYFYEKVLNKLGIEKWHL